MRGIEKFKRIFSKNSDIGTTSFNVGILFLASAPFISCLFFIYPLIKGLIKPNINFLEDRFNKIFLIISIILISKSLISSFLDSPKLENWSPALNWAGITNLIPLFLCFISFKTYLDTSEKRKKISKLFIAGTIPVLLSCVGQFFLKWYGPYDIFEGLIIWFQRPLTESNQNLTGLFSNPNYAGVWLTMMWPISIVLLKDKLRYKEYLKSKIIFFIIFFITFFLFLTNSRNAWAGLLITIPFLLSKKFLKWYFIILSVFIVFIFSSFLPFFPIEIREFSSNFIPSNVQNKLIEITLDIDTYPRLAIWSNAFLFILQKPLFGWGANTFPFLYNLKTGLWNNHSHNLFLELSISYGLIVSTLLFIVFISILIKSFYFIFVVNNKVSIIDKGWWAAGFIFLFSHLYDILIYDIRINLASWIFLIGLNNDFKNNQIQNSN